MNKHGVLGNGFADDCAAIMGGTKLGNVVKRVQRVVTELVDWGKTCGLEFNKSKTIAVVFTCRKKPLPEKLKIDGQSIEYSNSAKYLGVTLDS